MRHIKLINFVELCSESFFPVLDYCYEAGFLDEQYNIIVDFKKRNIKQIFNTTITEKINKENNHCGIIKVFVNTCNPKLNWRTIYEGVLTSNFKYQIEDESILVDKAKLENLIDATWKLLIKNGNYLHLEDYEIDSIDLCNIAKSLIGESYVDILPNRFLLISDSNIKFERNDNVEKCLISKIESKLVEQKLL